VSKGVIEMANLSESAFDAEWRARFERFARKHHGEAEISGWSELGLRRRVQLFDAVFHSMNLPRGAKILDLGCGAGTYVRRIGDRGYRVVGIDYSLPTLKHAAAADQASPGRYLVAGAYALPFVAEAFDLVLCIGVLQAVAHPELALAEMSRVLRTGGILIVEALNGTALSALAHQALASARRLPPRVRYYRPRKIQEWIRSTRLRVVRRVGLCLPPRWLPAAAGLLDSRPAVRCLTLCPALAFPVAHSFLFIARKDLL
jgi:SAM-dependent methyltransferase